MAVTRLTRFDEIPAQFWPAAGSYPFLSPGFLGALERSGAASTATGWQPAHLLLTDQGLLPSYLKSHSRGEYVFDQAWAAAYQRHGLAYYPRLVSAIPFTPVRGPRCLLASGQNEGDAIKALLTQIPEATLALGASSWHGLFLEPAWQEAAREQGLALRAGCQFYWQDRGFGDFEGFLASLTAKRRKTLRRERGKVQEAGIYCQRLPGTALEAAHWAFFYRCYASTYLQRGQRPYLNPEFFQALQASLAEQLMLVLAYHQGQPVAAALFLHDAQTLYGRYWGCTADIDCLHFEVCYYQGIAFCLEHGLSRFDPGTQGEHKLTRGFAPELSWSAHWLAEPGFMQAVQRFVAEEEAYVRQYQAQAMALLPYKD